MKRFLIVTTVIVLTAWAGWRYLPDGARGNMLGFAGLRAFASSASARDALQRAILSEDPASRRRIAASALRRAVAQTQKRAGIAGTDVDAPDGAENISDADLARTTEDLIRALEEAPSPLSLPRRALESVVERVLPARERADCPAP